MPQTTFYYHSSYNYGRFLPLREVHGFVLDKAKKIKARLMDEHGLSKKSFHPPTPLPTGALERVHSAAHLKSLHNATDIAIAVELPFLSKLPSFMVRSAIVTPQIWATRGTICALRDALRGGWAFNLAGGYHHARPELAHGFCLIADVAVAIRVVQPPCQVLVIDLDTHHGDGNAVACLHQDNVFTVSMHEEAAFPHPKPPSDIDIHLPSGLQDRQYLSHLQALLSQIEEQISPKIIIYIAGTDILSTDPLGSQQVSIQGCIKRDQMVAQWSKKLGAGLVTLPAGGYSAQSPIAAADGFAAIYREAHSQ